jgi:hypothetical protein
MPGPLIIHLVQRKTFTDLYITGNTLRYEDALINVYRLSVGDENTRVVYLRASQEHLDLMEQERTSILYAEI